MNTTVATTWSKGDRVIIIANQYGRETLSATTVKSVSATGQITLENKQRYMANGSQIGSDKFSPYCRMLKPTSELVERLKRQRLLDKLPKTKWQDLPTDVLAAIDELIKAETKEQES